MAVDWRSSSAKTSTPVWVNCTGFVVVIQSVETKPDSSEPVMGPWTVLQEGSIRFSKMRKKTEFEVKPQHGPEFNFTICVDSLGKLTVSNSRWVNNTGDTVVIDPGDGLDPVQIEPKGAFPFVRRRTEYNVMRRDDLQFLLKIHTNSQGMLTMSVATWKNEFVVTVKVQSVQTTTGSTNPVWGPCTHAPKDVVKFPLGEMEYVVRKPGRKEPLAMIYVDSEGNMTLTYSPGSSNFMSKPSRKRVRRWYIL